MTRRHRDDGGGGLMFDTCNVRGGDGVKKGVRFSEGGSRAVTCDYCYNSICSGCRC